MKHIPKFFALFLGLAILLTSLPLPVSAAETGYLQSDVPLLFQTDYPEFTYDRGTLATHGSHILSLAMVASYVTGSHVRPEGLAASYEDSTAHSVDQLEKASEDLGLSWHQAENVHAVFDALAQGKIAIAYMNRNSIFVGTEHYIVLAGLTSDGRIVVNDPYGPAYSDPLLENAFRVGFQEGDIICGFSGGWIYDTPYPPTITYPPETEETSDPTEPEETAEPEQTQPAATEPIEIPDAPMVNGVPLYFQTDYPNVRFGYGTLATSGCSAACLAMVGTYLTGHEYLPDEMADYFGGYGENNIQKLEYGSDKLKLPWSRAKNVNDVFKCLKEGNIAIVMMRAGSIFTSYQHMVVLTGYNEDGKILINDPNEANYSNWLLSKAFQEGFEEGDIIHGYDGAWLYDVSAMPKEPFIYKEEKVQVEPRYPDISLTKEEEALLAKIIWVEARGESAEGQQAVAEVVFNRMMSDKYPDSLEAVIYSQGQFDSVNYLNKAKSSQAQFDAIQDALNGPYILPMEVVHFSKQPVNGRIWGKIGRHVFCYGS